jgi:predicted aspartyl protease
MGSFSAKLRVWNPIAPENVEEIVAMVDTGAAFSWIHRERLERLGVEFLRRIGFRAIDGSIIERDTVAVWVGSNGFKAPDIVVMAEPNDMEVIGVHTIEGLGLAADPVQKKLIPTVMPALHASEAEAEDPDGDLIKRIAAVEDFAGTVLCRDEFADWNLVKGFGDFLIRTDSDATLGRVLLVRAYRHLGHLPEALDQLRQCRDQIAEHELMPMEAAVLLPVLSKEEELLSHV